MPSRRTLSPMLIALPAVLAFGMISLDDPPKPNDSRLGAKPPEKAEVLFSGKDLSGWTGRDGKAPAAWTVTDGLLTVKPGSGDIMTEKKYGDFELHVEFNCPYMPDAKGQARGNSGVYLAGNTELQVLDSYGLKLQNDDCGAIYKQIIPSSNAAKPPLQWQSYDVTFHKAKLEGDKVVKKARVTVIWNGVKTIDDAEIDPTPGGVGNPAGTEGPILLQDHGNLVEYRNIWIRPLE